MAVQQQHLIATQVGRESVLVTRNGTSTMPVRATIVIGVEASSLLVPPAKSLPMVAY
jgi:hypothetical protein